MPFTGDFSNGFSNGFSIAGSGPVIVATPAGSGAWADVQAAPERPPRRPQRRPSEVQRVVLSHGGTFTLFVSLAGSGAAVSATLPPYVAPAVVDSAGGVVAVRPVLTMGAVTVIDADDPEELTLLGLDDVPWLELLRSKVRAIDGGA